MATDTGTEAQDSTREPELERFDGPSFGSTSTALRSVVSEGAGPEAARSRDRRYRHLLALADLLAAGLALVLCVPLLGHGDQVDLAGLALLPAVLLASKVIGLYDRDQLLLRPSTLDEVPALFQLATFSALVVWLGNSIFVVGELGRDQVLGFWGVFLVLLALGRITARRLARVYGPPERCLVLGDLAVVEHARRKIEDSDGVDARVVAQTAIEGPDGQVLSAEDLGAAARECDAHRVLIAPSNTDSGEVLDLMRAAKALGLQISVLPRMLEVMGSAVEYDDLDGVGLLGMRQFELSRSSRLVKRATDIAGAALGLTVIAPLLAIIAAAIKLDSRGPVLFRQQRVGRDGELFEMVKFRTMGADAEAQKAALAERNEADGLFKIADDPRITRVGRLLRVASLDELPQLINVVKGEMSLVGPRPLVVEDDQRVEGWYRRRLHLTPGMTGRWQVLGSARLPLAEMVKLDYIYVANWTLWGDVKLLLRTLPYMLGRKGL